ncbi:MULTISPECIES: WXG100 family type VII secretion target [unclassified Streptomyces]|uniref:WXG100 family type VII secretion target n=1 Tax=unclassified Streptomyces TaxID=2593676 RepID=UPI002E79F228|nr:WXG100 family type VII secretion target [Streptomyces sp. JV184]MEE1745760.1 WXG100 family type VII secretion target [Streptomyces sp. JV184]
MAEQPAVSVGGVTYRVTPEYLANASSSTARTATEIAGQLAELKAYVTSLEASWQGIAHTQFQTLMAEYDVYARMLHDALEGISKGLQGNYVNYKESEQQNLNNLAALGQDVPKIPSGTNFN